MPKFLDHTGVKVWRGVLMNNPFTLTYLSLPQFTLLFPLNCVTPHPATHTCYSLLSPIPFVILPFLPLVLFSSIRSHTGRSTKSRHKKFPVFMLIVCTMQCTTKIAYQSDHNGNGKQTMQVQTTNIPTISEAILCIQTR